MDKEAALLRFIDYRLKEISLADEKASRLVTMAGAGSILTALTQFAVRLPDSHKLFGLGAIVPLAVFTLAIILAILTIYPRRLAVGSKTIWSDTVVVRRFPKDVSPGAMGFVESLGSADEVAESAELALELAHITTRKYSMLRRAARSFIAAVILLFIYLSIAAIIQYASA